MLNRKREHNEEVKWKMRLSNQPAKKLATKMHRRRQDRKAENDSNEAGPQRRALRRRVTRVVNTVSKELISLRPGESLLIPN